MTLLKSLEHTNPKFSLQLPTELEANRRSRNEIFISVKRFSLNPLFLLQQRPFDLTLLNFLLQPLRFHLKSRVLLSLLLVVLQTA